MSVVAEAPPAARPARRRLRPYLNWLEASRERWKARAVRAQAEALALRRQVRRLTANRDHWRQQARAARAPQRPPRPEPGKNGVRS